MGWTKVQHGKKATACSKLHSASCCCEAASKHARSNQARNKAPSRQLTLRVGRHLARLGVLHRETIQADVFCQPALPCRHVLCCLGCSTPPSPSTTLLLSPPPPHLDHDHLGLLLLLGPGLVAALILTVRRRHQARRARLLACSSGSSGRPGVAAVAAATAQPAAAARPLQRRMQINCCTANAISGARKASRRGKERHVPAACRCSAVYRLNGTSIPHQWAGDSQSPRLHRAGPDRAPCP